ncbi:hypothetical protein AB0P19_07025 [Microbacterium oleivorans]|uniref:hypothetical protein n=1 Tax=Microbacterium oleivorans TaxID=273677 RepID=UPI0033D57EA2
MTFNFTPAKPTRFSIHDATVTHRGDEYIFWAELDLLDDSFTTEFNDDQPQGDFDWDGFESEVEKHIRTAVQVQTGPAQHSEGCIGFHTSCVECTDDDNLNVCVTEFGARDFCSNHEEES